jgi:polysaccharide export outer membrane protein
MGFRLALLLLTILSIAPALTIGSAWGQSPVQANAAYALAPQDSISIRVIDQPELQFQGRIGPDGYISFPYLGRVELATLTESDAAELIRKGLVQKGILKNPQVIVNVISFGQQVSVLGEVGRPGIYPIDRPLNLIDLLAEAGGIKTETAGAYLVLQSKGADDKTSVEKVDIDKLLRGTDATLNTSIHNNETIYVPLAPVYYVSGYVNRPGEYPMRRPLTVEQAIAAAGGVRDTGSGSGLRIERAESGVTREIKPDQRDLVEPNDVLVVPEAWF